MFIVYWERTTYDQETGEEIDFDADATSVIAHTLGSAAIAFQKEFVDLSRADEKYKMIDVALASNYILDGR
jgi:hypothetical protein